MRVLFTGNVGESLPPPYAGIPKRALLVARAMREAGHVVGLMFVYRHDAEDDLGAGAEYFFDYPYAPARLDKVFYMVRGFIQSPILFIRLLWVYIKMHRVVSRESLVNAAHGVKLDHVVRDFKPDVILSEAAIIRTFMAVQIAKRYNIPIVIDTYAEVHDPSVLKLRGGNRHRTQYWTELLETPALIIAPSYFCGKGPQSFVSAEKVQIIYAGIEFEKYHNYPLSKAEARKKLGLPEDVFLVTAVGSLAPRKGHDHMLEAIAKLPASVSVHAVICGPGDPTWLRDIARKHGILDRVHFFTGLSEDDLIALYRAVDLYCDASNTPRACLGMSVTEAMAVGMPIVSYNVGGLPEIVREGENGHLVPTGDINALSAAIARIYELPKSEYEQYVAKGVQLSAELVDIRVCAKKMIEAIEAVYRAYSIHMVR